MQAILRAAAWVFMATACVIAQAQSPQAQSPQAQTSEVRPPESAESEAAAPHAPVPEPEVADSTPLDEFVEQTRTLEAQFSQQLLDAQGGLVEAAAGSFSLKRPDRFLWSYREPLQQQVVADSANLWIYDEELQQVTVTPLAGAVSSSPAMLLSGDARVRDEFQIVERFRDGTFEWLSLVPREVGADFNSVLVGFDAGVLAALELVDALGQVTSIRFSDVMVNVDIDDEFFRFDPPAGADVIGDPVALSP